MNASTHMQESAERELARWRGIHAVPQAGCKITSLPLGDATVPVEYEFLEAEAAQPNADRPGPGPGFAASVVVISALVNGSWIDADVFSEAQIERWEQAILEDEAKD